MTPDPKDVEALKREKPDWTEADIARLASGEPLAYVIGNVPFLGLTIDLFSHPLIPRPETEWWAEELARHIGMRDVRVLDLCAGSGAVGLALLKLCPNARVSFGELMEEHEAVIRKNIKDNGLDAARADIRIGDLFAPFPHDGARVYAEERLSEPLELGSRSDPAARASAASRRRGPTRTPAGVYPSEGFDIIATNPPYIPKSRTLDGSVARFEPAEALYAGEDGLAVVRRIAAEAAAHLEPNGELWIECDISNVEEASALAREGGARHTEIRTDQYQRPRLLVAYYSHD